MNPFRDKVTFEPDLVLMSWICQGPTRMLPDNQLAYFGETPLAGSKTDTSTTKKLYGCVDKSVMAYLTLDKNNNLLAIFNSNAQHSTYYRYAKGFCERSVAIKKVIETDRTMMCLLSTNLDSTYKTLWSGIKAGSPAFTKQHVGLLNSLHAHVTDPIPMILTEDNYAVLEREIEVLKTTEILVSKANEK